MWHAYRHPASDVARSDYIGSPSEATRCTEENGLGFAILLGAISTCGAGTRGISGVNKVDRNTGKHGLIFNKLSQLGKGPGMERCALRLSSPRPRADALQIFQGNGTLRAFGFRNDFLGENVIHMPGKPAFLTGKLLKSSPGSLRSLLLELLAKMSVTVADILNCLAGVDFSIAIGSDVGHAKVDSQDAFNVNWRGRFNLAGSKQIPLAIQVNEVTLPLAGLKELPLPLAANERNFPSPVDSPDGDKALFSAPSEDSVIIGNRPMISEGPLDFPVQLVGVHHLNDAMDGNLGREVKLFSHFPVKKLLEFVLPEGLGIPGYLRDVVASCVGPLHGFKEGLGLRWVGLKFYLGYQFHTLYFNTIAAFCLIWNGLKRGVSSQG